MQQGRFWNTTLFRYETKSTKIRKELLEVHKDAFITVDEFGNEDTSNYNMVSSLLIA